MTNARNSNSRRDGRRRGKDVEKWNGKLERKNAKWNEMKLRYTAARVHGMVGYSICQLPISLSLTLSLPLSFCRLAMWPGCKCWNFKPLNVAIVFDERREDREEVERLTGRSGGPLLELACSHIYLHTSLAAVRPPAPLPRPVPLPICQLGCK